MGIASSAWFRSYLTNRKQKVKTNDNTAEQKLITCGVPQRSILGPLLYLCYKHDMELSVSCKLLYADDGVLLVSGENPKDISNTQTKELQSCSERLVDNKLSLQLGKTEAILCGSKRKLKKNVQDLEVKCNGVSIKPVSAVKYLGINIDSDMAGESTWKTIISKCNSRLKNSCTDRQDAYQRQQRRPYAWH